MDITHHSFRLAQRSAPLSTIEEGLKEIASMPTAILEKQVGPWDYQILAQAVLILRRRGLPQPEPTGGTLFAQVVMTLRTCQEISDDIADDSGGGKPSR